MVARAKSTRASPRRIPAGRSLKRLPGAWPASRSATSAYGGDMACGLAYLHGLSLVEGDVKGRNVVIGGNAAPG